MSEVKLTDALQFGEFTEENSESLFVGKGLFPVVPEIKTSFSKVEVKNSGNKTD